MALTPSYMPMTSYYLEKIIKPIVPVDSNYHQCSSITGRGFLLKLIIYDIAKMIVFPFCVTFDKVTDFNKLDYWHNRKWQVLDIFVSLFLFPVIKLILVIRNLFGLIHPGIVISSKPEGVP